MALSGRALADAHVTVHADMSAVPGEVAGGLNRAVASSSRGASRNLKDAIVKPFREGFTEAARAADPGGQVVGGKLRQGLAARLRGVTADTAKAGADAGTGLGKGLASKTRGIADQTAAVGAAAGSRFSRAAAKGVEKDGSFVGRAASSTAGQVLGAFGAAQVGMGAIHLFAGFIADARESARVGRDTENVIASTGGAAHVTADQVGDLATSISNKVGADDEAIQSGENMLLTFTNVRNEVGKGNDVFNQASAAAVDLAAKMNDGQVTTDGMKTASIQLGKALNDPIKGVTALTKVGVTFDGQQKAQIKTLVQSGRTLDAQKIILGELNKEFGGTAKAAADPMQRLGVILNNIGEDVGTALLPALDKVANVLADDVAPGLSKAVGFFAAVPGPVYAGVAALAALYGTFRAGKAVVGAVTDVVTSVGKAMQFLGVRAAEAAAAEGIQAGAATASVGANTAAAGAATRLGTAIGLVTKAAAGVGLFYGVTQLVGWAGSASVATVNTDQFAASLTNLGQEGDASFRHIFNRAGWGDFTVDTQSGGEALDKFADAMQIAFGQGFLDKSTRLLSFGASASRAKGQIGELDAGLAALAKGNAAAAAESFGQLAGKLTSLGYSQAEITAAFPAYTASVAAAAAASDAASKAVGYTGSVLTGAATGAAATAATFHQLASGAAAATAAEKPHSMTLKALTDLYPKFKDQIMASVGATARASGETGILTAKQVAAAESAVQQKQAVDALTSALSASSNATLALRGSDTAYHAAVAAVTDAVKANGRTLDINTAKGRANRDTLDALSRAGLGYLDTIQKNNGVGPKFRSTLDQQRNKLIEAAKRFGLGDKAARAYADRIYKVPKALATKVTTPGLDTANKKVRDLKANIDRLGNKALKITVNSDGTFTQGTRTGRAAGGPIPGSSPSPTADNIPIAATAGEHMWSVAEVRGAGGHGQVERLRGMARTGGLPRFAAGGRIRLQGSATVPSAAALNKVINADMLAAFKAVNGTGGGGPVPKGAGVARWGPMVHQALTARHLPQSLWDNWMRQIGSESGGNPRAVQGNIGDVNNRSGDLAEGLLQVIGATFRAYHVPGTSWSRFDAWANMNAAMNYASHRYSNLEAVIGHGHGYRSGTASADPGWAWTGEDGPELVKFRGGEQVRSASASAASADGRTVRLHPDDIAVLAAHVATAASRRPLVLDGAVVASYVDRSLGRASLSMRS